MGKRRRGEGGEGVETGREKEKMGGERGDEEREGRGIEEREGRGIEEREGRGIGEREGGREKGRGGGQGGREKGKGNGEREGGRGQEGKGKEKEELGVRLLQQYTKVPYLFDLCKQLFLKFACLKFHILL